MSSAICSFFSLVTFLLHYCFSIPVVSCLEREYKEPPETKDRNVINEYIFKR